MSRHFTKEKGSDWLSVYQMYAANAFVPASFHTWAGIGCLSSVLERKVWVEHGNRRTYANTYILMISKPGVGKSSAINIAVNDFLRKITGPGQLIKGINFLSNQSSEAGFYSPQLEHKREFYVGNQKMTQSPGLLALGEAGNSLKEIAGGGSICKALTEFYDCLSHWDKSLTGKAKIELTNLYISIMAGCTFSDLPGIIPRASLEGGFASRFIFVPEFDKGERKPPCIAPASNEVLRLKLVDDLQSIYSISGEFRIDPEFEKEWSERHALSDRKANSAPNSQLECLLARRFLNIEKLALITTISEGDSRLIKKANWDRAEMLYDAQADLLPRMLEYTNIGEDQKTITESMCRFVESGNRTKKDVKRYLYESGVDPFRIDANIEFCLNNDKLVVGPDGFVKSKVTVDEKTDVSVDANGVDMQAQLLPTEMAHQTIN